MLLYFQLSFCHIYRNLPFTKSQKQKKFSDFNYDTKVLEILLLITQTLKDHH